MDLEEHIWPTDKSKKARHKSRAKMLRYHLNWGLRRNKKPKGFDQKMENKEKEVMMIEKEEKKKLTKK